MAFGRSPAWTEKEQRLNAALVRNWLYFVVLVLFCLVLVGGATRLTHSGLSITQWKPLHGVIPPLNLAQWQEEFELYKRIPEYQLLNKGMTLSEFQGLFWWEWAHRLLARTVGLIFAVPLCYFWLSGRLSKGLGWPLLGVLALGGLQGFIGWWMVSSGLSDRTDVSQYRLAVHLIMACLIIASSVYIGRGLKPRRHEDAPTAVSHALAVLLILAAFVQIYLGALVAGLDAGLSYNTWPLMDGALVPNDLLLQQPAWLNFFENPKTVQFAHRCGGYVLLLIALAHYLVEWRGAVSRGLDLELSQHARGALLILIAILLQAVLGIITLVTQMPLGLALAHQAGAIIVLILVTGHLRGYRPPMIEVD
ncbi:COX15/CtaA family protein [Martelella endophytica]|uniref:Heme A synthase n=1 Tax=Martelella endophytica TaxID=1486262 RepID=A0A0D5LTE4_MAREN|nr:COX15/CtaA family protein [Martelella endophytica]AJY46648.1 heme A synthase [Martelella endophytica]